MSLRTRLQQRNDGPLPDRLQVGVVLCSGGQTSQERELLKSFMQQILDLDHGEAWWRCGYAIPTRSMGAIELCHN